MTTNWPATGRWTLQAKQSLLEVFVYKAPSLGSALAHDLVLNTRALTSELLVDEAGASLDARAELWELGINKGILNMIEWFECKRLMRKHVLKSEKLANARLQGRIERVPDGSPGLCFKGELAMLGSVSRALTMPIELVSSSAHELHARGRVSFLQSDYGIEPFSNMLGVFKLADEMAFSVDARYTR